jgi:hypothetical protein
MDKGAEGFVGHSYGTGLQCPRTFYTDLDTLICESEEPLSPNTLCV